MSARPDQRPMRALPVLESRRAALETCAFCPKLCRSACPVSNAEPKETLTPWGKMTTAYVTALGDAELSTEMSAPSWACTGCRACAHACDHENDVANTLLAARSATFDVGLAPPAALKVVANFGEHRRATREASAALTGSNAKANIALLVGCTYTRRARQEADDAIAAATALVGPVRVVDDCCGLPLLYAGDREGFEAHARTLSIRLREANAIVVVDPGCGVALRKEYPRANATLPKVTMLVEEAAARVQSLSTLADAREVRWHDPCQLGRGLGLYAEPRNILTRIFGRAPLEQHGSREQGRCSGGGGLLPITMPETAHASSLISLRRASGGRSNVSDLVSWIARAAR
jgi:dimethylglycine catabolism B